METLPSGVLTRNSLRHLAIYVTKVEPGKFTWVLMEWSATAKIWTDGRTGAEAFPMWIDAWEAGNVALLRLVVDERVGPRAEPQA